MSLQVPVRLEQPLHDHRRHIWSYGTPAKSVTWNQLDGRLRSLRFPSCYGVEDRLRLSASMGWNHVSINFLDS